MNKRFLTFLIAGATVASLSTTASAATFDELKAKGAQALLAHGAKVQASWKTANFEFEMVVKPKNGTAKTMTFEVFQKGNSARLVRFLGPGEVKGMSILAKGSTMYVYSPQTDNVRRVASSAKRQTLLGSNLENGDMETTPWDQVYDAKFGKDEGATIWLELTAKADAKVSYSKMKALINKKQLALVKLEYYEGSKLKRVQTFSDHKKQGSHLLFRKTQMKTVANGLVTTLTMKKHKLGLPLERSMFSKRSLVRGN